MSMNEKLRKTKNRNLGACKNVSEIRKVEKFQSTQIFCTFINKIKFKGKSD